MPVHNVRSNLFEWFGIFRYPILRGEYYLITQVSIKSQVFFLPDFQEKKMIKL